MSLLFVGDIHSLYEFVSSFVMFKTMSWHELAAVVNCAWYKLTYQLHNQCCLLWSWFILRSSFHRNSCRVIMHTNSRKVTRWIPSVCADHTWLCRRNCSKNIGCASNTLGGGTETRPSYVEGNLNKLCGRHDEMADPHDAEFIFGKVRQLGTSTLRFNEQ